jgi:hypothetical protein
MSVIGEVSMSRFRITYEGQLETDDDGFWFRRRMRSVSRHAPALSAIGSAVQARAQS